MKLKKNLNCFLSLQAMLQYVLILLVCLLVVKAIKPQFFPCDNDVNSSIVDCSHRALTFVPLIKSTTVVSLDLSKNKIQRVARNDFSGVPNLETLTIMWNCLPGSLRALDDSSCKIEILYDAFKGLTNLCFLYLSGNSLSSLPWLPDTLQVLDLGVNRIFNIIHPLNTPHLQQLLLSKNCFYANPCNHSFHIHEDVYRELSKLKVLALGYNNLTSVPTGLPPSLESLDLRENTITEVFEGAFANLTHLKNLSLEWNCQRCDHAARLCFPCPNNDSLRLHPKSLYAKNSSITYLSLRGNSLRDFPMGLFRPLGQLKRLDLSDNLLSYAIGHATFFTELRGLTWISLIYNYEPLKILPELILSPHLSNISGLRYLLLSGNFFHTLSTQSLEVLSKLRYLKKLELRMNFISSCNMSVLSQLPALTNVVLSQNMLNFLPCCSASNTHLAHRHSQYLSHQSSQSQNSYNTFHDFFDPARMLLDRKVDTSDLWEPPETTVSEMLEDNVSQIKTMWDFRNYFCRDSLTFDLSQNDIIFLNKHVFIGMEKAVCLDLSYNYMSQTLKGGQFHNMENLVYLNMAYNRIDLYFREAFNELSATLKVLDLSNNEYHFLMRGMGHRFEFLHNMTQLEVLSLANNGIGMRIDSRLKSNSLKYLYFSGNHLDIMWDSSSSDYTHFFQDLTNLTYLDISQNELRSVSPDVICNLPRSLEALSISDNHLKYFPWQNISTLNNLCHLNLSKNVLTYLPHAVIDFGPEFALLDLSLNKISSLPQDFFSKAKTLRYLYFSHNNLKQLNHQSLPAPLKNGSALQILTLHVNPFECDCDSSGLIEFLRTSPVQIPYLTTYVQCEFPESLQGQSVLFMDQRSCQEIYGSLAFLFSSLLAVAFTVLPLLKHLYGWDLWYCLQVLWAGHKGYSQLSGTDFHNHYDAFVVFDTENQAVRDWVYNEITVHLENSGHRRFRLCLEERDWVPGLSCIENLHNAVYSSVKTVFVLTSGGNSAGSGAEVNGVIRQAFFMVQQRLLDEKVCNVN